jgi:hypothetical protein
MAGTCKENGRGSDGKEDNRRLFVGRRKGRPRLRWMGDVVADLKVMKIKQWMEEMKDREKWRLIVEEAKAHPGI